MPSAAAIRNDALGKSAAGNEDEESIPTLSATTVHLLLPSALSPDEHSVLPTSLIEKYRKLRVAQAEDVLLSMKRNLRKGATLFNHKKQHTGGTGVTANTRMQGAISGYNDDSALDADTYRSARLALFALDSRDAWNHLLPDLKQADVRPPPQEKGPGQGYATLSWIWKASQFSNTVNSNERGTGRSADTNSELDSNNLELVNEGMILRLTRQQ